MLRSKLVLGLLAVCAALAVAACGSSKKTPTTSSSSSAATSSTASSSEPSLSISSFTTNFSAMTKLKPLAAAGKGKVAAIMPDTTSSTRYVQFDQPYIKKAFETAGISSSDIIVQNGQDSDSTFLSDAESDITNGATVLLIDPEDAGTGAKVASYAAAHGVKVIDYDRLTVGPYYVSFNNYHVGNLMAKGLVSCVAAWKVKSPPQVIFMHGSATDNNATQFAAGSMQVLGPLFKSGKWKEVAKTADTWTPNQAETEFAAAYTAHPNANAALIPNDETGAPIITYLKSKGVKPDTFPTTGQDATSVAMQNIISGYQCGTVYKPIYEEAQAAVALALYVRAGKTPPSSLLNGSSANPAEKGKSVPSVLLQPEWVTAPKIKSTVIHDHFLTAGAICTSTYAADCKKYGITG